MKGPFLSDLDISSYLRFSQRLAAVLATAARNILVCLLVMTGLLAQGGFAPRAFRTGETDWLATFTATMWMVTGRHRSTANSWADTFMALAAGLAQLDVAMIQIADQANSRIADLMDQADFTGRHTDLGKIAFLGE